MGNQQYTCLNCGIFEDPHNFQIKKKEYSFGKLVKVQSKIYYFLFRSKLSKFLKENKSKSFNILSRHGFDFLSEEHSNDFMQETNFKNNQFVFNFPFANNKNITNNPDFINLVTNFHNEIRGEIADFYLKLKKKKFQNIERLPAHKDNSTENVYYSFFNVMTLKNIGHYIILPKAGLKIEFNIRDYESDSAKGLIYYKNRDIYIGSLFLEKVIYNNANKNSSIMRIRSVEGNSNQQELISESNIQNMTPRFEDFGTRAKLENNKDLFEVHRENLEKIEFIEKIVNAYPYGEGILLKENELIYVENWLNFGQIKNESIVRIINEKYSIETNIINEKLNLKTVNLFDYTNESNYNGEIEIDYSNYDNNSNNNEIFPSYNFLKIRKSGEGRIIYKNGDFYDGAWKDNFYHGDGILFQNRHLDSFLNPEKNSVEFIEIIKKRIPINNYKVKEVQGITTKGTWSNGKLNGKGYVINNNVKEKCVWRFGRLINAVISLNKKFKIDEKIYEFMDDEDLLKIIYDVKNKALLDFLKSKNCKNLIRLKIYEGLSYNPQENSEYRKYISSSNSFFCKSLYNFFIQKNNYLIFFDSIFQYPYDSFIPTIAVANNGGYPNKILHYSNAFDPSRDTSYSSNYVKALGKNVELIAAFHNLDESSREKLEDKLQKIPITPNNNEKKAANAENKLSNENEIKFMNSNGTFNIDYTKEDLKNFEYLKRMAKNYRLVKRMLGSPTMTDDQVRSVFKFFLSIDFSKIFVYKRRKNLNCLLRERILEVDNLEINRNQFGKIFNLYSPLYEYDYNHRYIADKRVYENIRTPEHHYFVLNKIVIDIPFNAHILNKLILPAKTIAFFLHSKNIPKNSLEKFTIDQSELAKNSEIKSKLDTPNSKNHVLDKNLRIEQRIADLVDDKFLGKIPDVIDDRYQLNSLLDEIGKINNALSAVNPIKIHTNTDERKYFDKIINESTKKPLNIINIQKTNDNLFIEFDTQNQNISEVKLLGLVFLKEYDYPNIINLKPFYHIGKMVTVRLVNQNILFSSFQPSCIDVGSITFYGGEFNMK